MNNVTMVMRSSEWARQVPTTLGFTVLRASLASVPAWWASLLRATTSWTGGFGGFGGCLKGEGLDRDLASGR